MDNLLYIHELLCYAEGQRELADDMYSMQAWDQRIDALQCAYNFIADQGVSKEARESVPHSRITIMNHPLLWMLYAFAMMIERTYHVSKFIIIHLIVWYDSDQGRSQVY